MDYDHGFKFVCKLCNKKYLCGKSLGGHMKSHVIANSAESEKKLKFNSSVGNNDGESSFTKLGEFGNGQTSYGLRENPRKTKRAMDSSPDPLPMERVCKQCGKGFQSMKALCGHMACHSEKDRVLKDDHSLTSENCSDNEEVEEWRLRTRSSTKNKNYLKNAKSPCFSLANNGSSSVSEIDGQDQEELAICLMLLSRDLFNKNGVNSLVESSDNNSFVFETKSSSIDKKGGLSYVYNQEETPKMNKFGDVKLKGSYGDNAQTENSDSGYFLDECAKADSDASVGGSHMTRGLGDNYGSKFQRSLNRIKKDNEYYDDDNGMASNFAGIDSRKRKYTSENTALWNEPTKISKYECFNCKKSFKSYQALGGHRPCHKKSVLSYESGENSLDDDSTDFKGKSMAKNHSHYADKKVKAKKNKVHACPFCDRVFKNGQALGGHKRSHFIGGHEETRVPTPVVKPDLLDLNLPAPEEDEDDQRGQFISW